MEFKLTQEFIELFKLIKLFNLAASGAEAKQMISEGLVKVNGQVETRKAFKVRSGHRVEAGEEVITVL